MKNERILRKEQDRLSALIQGFDVAARMDPVVAAFAARQAIAWVLGDPVARPSKAFVVSEEPPPPPPAASADDIFATAQAFFTTHKAADQIHAIVDTAPINGEPVPHLNLWAFRLVGDVPFEAVLATAIATEDPSRLEDALEEIGAHLDCLDLSGCYWDWPRAMDEGEAVVTAVIERAWGQVGAAGVLYFGYAGSAALRRLG